MTRHKLNQLVTILGMAAAAASLIFGMLYRLDIIVLHKWFGAAVVAGWILGPPVWFWADWVMFSSSQTNPAERDRIKHLHGLSRNVWLGLVVVLAALYGVPLFKTGS